MRPRIVATRSRPVENAGSCSGYDETVVMPNRPLKAASQEEAMSTVVELTDQALRDALDRELPAVGGVPRQRVATPEGRAAVEAWLRGLERHGQAEEMPGGRMLDLDPIRRELGCRRWEGEALEPVVAFA